MSKFEQNLTEGSVTKQLILFSIPFFISNLIQSIYSVADMIILSYWSGTPSVSASGTGGQIMIILTNLAVGISTGGSVIIGQYLGANKREHIKDCISTLLLTLWGIGLIISILLFIFAHPVLRILNTPEEAYAESYSYLIISSLGILFTFGYNALSAIMRGLGDSKTPFIFVTIACIANILLDIGFVALFPLGAAGAALATILAQGFSMFSCMVYLKKHDFLFDFRPSSYLFSKKMFNTLMKVGLPSGIQNVATNFSFLILTALINSYGVDASAGAGFVGKFNSFAILPCLAISMSTSAMISQNIGADKWKRVYQASGVCLGLGYGVCAFIFALSQLFPHEILGLFTTDSPVIAQGVTYFRSFSFEYCFLPLIIGFNSLFIGAGNGWISMITNILSAFFVRIPLALFFSNLLELGLFGVGLSVPCATLVGSLAAFVFFLTGCWKKVHIQ